MRIRSEEIRNERRGNINRETATELADLMFVPSSLVRFIRKLDKEKELRVPSKAIFFEYAGAIGLESARLGGYYKAIESLVNYLN